MLSVGVRVSNNSGILGKVSASRNTNTAAAGGRTWHRQNNKKAHNSREGTSAGQRFWRRYQSYEQAGAGMVAPLHSARRDPN